MGLTDFIRSQFIDIIEWTDDSRDTLSYRFPDDDKEIKRGAQLIVRHAWSSVTLEAFQASHRGAGPPGCAKAP